MTETAIIRQTNRQTDKQTDRQTVGKSALSAYTIL